MVMRFGFVGPRGCASARGLLFAPDPGRSGKRARRSRQGRHEGAACVQPLHGSRRTRSTAGTPPAMRRSRSSTPTGGRPACPSRSSSLAGSQPLPAVSADETARLPGRAGAALSQPARAASRSRSSPCHRAWSAILSSAISVVAQRLGLSVDVARTGRVWLAVYRRRGEG